ncbi:MAG: hypothetical protein CR981_03145 [Proteobacteria bacterium]|nr:MAG: hypothetical protein CR981_03145 [Pseudomonadota bacterium]
MKILTVSDRIVKKLVEPDSASPVSGIDLILGGGDLPPEYLAALRNHYHVPLFYILGNHDIRHEIVPTGCIDISRRIISFNGCTFVGFSGSRWYNGNNNQYHEKEMRSQIRKLWFQLWRQQKIDVMLTHAPPRHIHDAEDQCHKGFKCYNRFIEKYSPRFFVHGHIHRFFEKPEDRISIINQTQVINSYGYHIFEI